MGIQDQMNYERAQKYLAQTHRKRYNSGMTGTNNKFSLLSIGDLLSHMFNKVINLE